MRGEYRFDYSKAKPNRFASRMSEGTGPVQQYLVVYEKSADGWGAYVPDLPGLGVVGDMIEEVQTLIREGIELHLESLKEHGDPILKPAAKSDYVKVDESLLA